MDLNKLQKKIQEFLKDNDLDKLKDNYKEPTTNDDFIDYQPLPENVIDDSNEDFDKALQFKIDKWGF